ncbi:hypothetical protein [Haladaptatus sp. DFWS20]|uniref:hypothetical protein n=1 Tax=Haladaptatus sp. DFWS20 TaxID=3403467 RepID=UPI003EBE0FBC
MQRRNILKQAGAAVTVGTLAGCLSQGGSPGGQAPDDGSGETSTTTTEGTTETATETTTSTDTTTESKPALQNRSLKIVDAGCADGASQKASVKFNESKKNVVVTGTIQTSDPCYVAKLGAVNYDRKAGTLSVTIRAKKQKGVSACQQCLGAIEYESKFTFASGVPKSVTISHETQGETKEVTTAEYDGAKENEGA